MPKIKVYELEGRHGQFHPTGELGPAYLRPIDKESIDKRWKKAKAEGEGSRSIARDFDIDGEDLDSKTKNKSGNRVRKAARTLAVGTMLVGASVGVSRAMGDSSPPAGHHFESVNYVQEGVQPASVSSRPENSGEPEVVAGKR